MRDDRNTGTAEMKAVGQEILQLGARCLHAGKAWFDQRRHDMAQRYNQNEDQYRGDRGTSERPRGTAPRWDDEDGGYGHSQYGSQDRGRTLGGRHGQPTGENEKYMGASRYGGDMDRDQPSSRYGQGDRDAYGFNRGGYDQSRQTPGREYGAQRGYAAYGPGAGSDRDEDISTYGRQGSLGGGRGAYAGNYQTGQYNDDVSRGDPWRESSDSRRQGSRYQSDSSRQSWADRPSRSSSSMDFGEQSGGKQYGFRGRGPKNYSRSDERIAEDLNERLMDADDIDATEVSVQVKDGVAILEGTVGQRWMKHRIEDVAEACGGVKDVENRIRVQSARTDDSVSERSPSTGTGGDSRRTTSSSASGRASATATGQTGSEPGTAGTAH